MTRVGGAALVALLSLAPAASAQQPLSLAAAQAEARAHAPEVAELNARVQAAAAFAAQARRAFRQNPTIAGGYANGALAGQTDETAWSIGVSLPVDLSGSWKPRASSATADVTRSQFERDDGLRALDEQVAIAVADVELQQRLVTRSQRIADLQALAADAAHRQLAVGQTADLDADSADLDVAAARAAVEQARGGLARARAELARLLGRTTSDDLMVEDPPEPVVPPSRPDVDALIERDPRVRAARAEVKAATFEGETAARMAVPQPTFGIDFGSQRREIPAGSFTGAPFASALTATWPDRELTFNFSVPVPWFDRQQESRARATGRILAAQASLQAVRATVRAELDSTWAAFDAAARALQAVTTMPGLIDRDSDFVEQAVRAGAFDTLTRTQALRRLIDAGQLADLTVRDFRAARAAWIRRTSGL